jgi:hypothetical protein
MLGAMLIPALEKAEIRQAGSRYAGAYNSDKTNASLIIAKPDGTAGL